MYFSWSYPVHYVFHITSEEYSSTATHLIYVSHVLKTLWHGTRLCIVPHSSSGNWNVLQDAALRSIYGSQAGGCKELGGTIQRNGKRPWSVTSMKTKNSYSRVGATNKKSRQFIFSKGRRSEVRRGVKSEGSKHIWVKAKRRHEGKSAKNTTSLWCMDLMWHCDILYITASF